MADDAVSEESPQQFPPGLGDLRSHLSRLASDARGMADKLDRVAGQAEDTARLIDWLETEAWPEVRSGGPGVGLEAFPSDTSVARYQDHVAQATKSLGDVESAVDEVSFELGQVASAFSTRTASTAAVLDSDVEVRLGAPETHFNFPVLDRTAVWQEMDDRLRNLGLSELVEKRKGAWETFRRAGTDANSQACYSMRDVLTELLDEYAPVEEVKKADWWEPDETRTHDVSKRQKIRYFVWGAEEPPDPDLEEATEVVEAALRAHNRVVEAAHPGKIPGRNATRALLVALEDAVRNLLNKREAVGYEKSLRWLK